MEQRLRASVVKSLYGLRLVSPRIKQYEVVRRPVASNLFAISWAIEDLPVPAWPKSIRALGESTSSTQSVMAFRNLIRVPLRQLFSGLNLELGTNGNFWSRSEQTRLP